MHFCQGDDQQYTQCCFFNESSQNIQQIIKRGQDEGIENSKRRNVQKNLPLTLKQTRIISKNYKKQKSQQKGKLSLSKISGKKTGHSRGLFSNQQSNVIIQTYSSAPKERQVSQTYNKNNQKHRSNHNQIQGNYQFKTYMNCEQLKFLYKQQTKNKQSTNFYQNYPLNSRVQSYENNKLGLNQQGNYYNNYSANSTNQITIPINQPYNTFQSHFRVYGQPQPKQFSFYQENSFKNHHNLNIRPLPNKVSKPSLQTFQSQKFQKLKIKQSRKNIEHKSTYPTLQTERMICSGVKQNPNNSKISLSNQYIKKSTTLMKGQLYESQYSNNNHLSPQVSHSKLKTVQSIFSQEVSGRKQQSIILIDFFNPSQTLKKQLEANIQKKRKTIFDN